jgi:hypothetical protein
MPRYLIKGETGKTLGAGGVWLGDTLKAVGASLRFESLGMDRLTWTARTVDIDAGETTLPDVGQRVELFYDLTDLGFGQIRLFRGWVTEARAINYGVVVVVEGPWQFFRKMTATTSKTLNGSTDTRPTMDFASGSIATHVATVVARAIAEGAPATFGGMTTAYTVQKLKLSQATYADVIAELLRWVPDCIAYWDYQSAPAGNAIFTVARRSALGSTTYTAGTDELVDHQVTGRPDLVPTRVDLKYVRRGADQRPVYDAQSAGTSAGSTAPGKSQVIVISGDEADTYLPPDDYNSYTVQTYDANATLNNTRIRLLPVIPQVVASRAQFSGRPNATDVVLANGETITLQTSTSGVGTRTYPQPALQFLNPETGAPISRVGKRFLMSPPPPEWAEGVLANAEKVKIVGRIYRIVESTLLNSSGGGGIDAPGIEDWAVAFPWSSQLLLTGFYPSTTILGYPWARVYLYALDFEIETYLTTSNFPSATTIYKPQDFDYTAPPSGLASSLLAAQNFTPYEGYLELSYAGPTPGPGLASLFNVAGAQAELATMAALPRAVSLDLQAYKARVDLGSPARFNLGTLSGKVRSSPQTNITVTNS